MKLKIRLIALGFILLFVLMYNSSSFIAPLTNSTMQTQTWGGNYTKFAEYAGMGQFTRWINTTLWKAFVNTGAYVEGELEEDAGVIKTGIYRWNATDISTAFLRTGQCFINHYGIQRWSDGNALATLKAVFTDATSQTLGTEDYGESDIGKWSDTWINTTFTSSKTLNYLQLEYAAVNYHAAIRIVYENYSGYAPTISNYTIMNARITPNVDTTFASISNCSTAFLECSSEWGGATTIAMTATWEKPQLWMHTMTFAFEGLYQYRYTAKNTWNVQTETPTHYFRVTFETFPKTAYLSLYNSLDGFPLISPDFKVYLGDPDMRELINFRTYYGNWSALYSNSYVNASLITDGWISNTSLVDNYINLTAARNGLKSTFENNYQYDTNLWETLQFQIMVTRPTWIVIIYNPLFWEKDFYLQFTNEMIGYWYDVSIPFYNFTTYRDIMHNWLYEIGFWIENASVCLSNIRVARYYTPSFSLTTYNFTKSQNIQQNLTPIETSNWGNWTAWENNTYDVSCDIVNISQTSAINLTFNAIPEWNNQSSYLFETNFNITGFTSENITIVENETLQLTFHDTEYDTGHFQGLYSFTDDANGANPAGWVTSEPSGTSAQIVDSFDGHNKVLEMSDLSGGVLTAAQSFSAQTSGAIELWASTDRTTDVDGFAGGWSLKSGSSTYALTVAFIDGWIQCYYGSAWHKTTIPCLFDINVLYHIRVIFDCLTDLFDLYVNQTLLQIDIPFRTLVTSIDSFQHGGASSGQYINYLDAVDYSWADGYYTNRNMDEDILSEAYFENAGYYLSTTYDLGDTEYFFYQTLNVSLMGISHYPPLPDDPVGITVQFHTSTDNLTWSAWSEAFEDNLVINDYDLQYFQFCVNLTLINDLTPAFYALNLSYILCDITQYSLNQTFYVNFTEIQKANIYDITLNAIDGEIYDDFSNVGNLNAFGKWFKTSGTLYENSTHAIFNTTVCSDYFSTHKIAGGAFIHFDNVQFIYTGTSSIPYTIGLAPTTSALWRATIAFKDNGEVYYTIYNSPYYDPIEGLLTTVANGSVHDYSIAHYNDNFMFYVDSVLIINRTEPDYANMNSMYLWLDLQGYGEAKAGNRLYIDTISNRSFPQDINGAFLFYNFTSNQFDLFNYTMYSNYQLDFDYFNTTSIHLLINLTSAAYFTIDLSISIQINYFYYQNASYTYFYDLPTATLYYLYNFTLNYSEEINTSITFQWRTSADNISWSAWSEALEVEAYNAQYLQYKIDCNTTWYYNTSIFNSADLLYRLENCSYFYVLNTTFQFTFAYNSSYYLMSMGIYTVYMSLIAQNQSLYEIALYNYSSLAFSSIATQNYTNELIGASYYNLSEFRMRFYINSTIDYLFNYSIALNNSYYEIWNLTLYTPNSYRLISTANRQDPQELVFNEEWQTLAILDYFDNILYISDINYSEWEGWVDIGLPICDFTFYNYADYPILARIYRGIGTWIEIVIPPQSSITQPVFCTQYKIWIATQQLRELAVTWVSPNQSRTYTITWGTSQNITIPDFWDRLLHFLFQSLMGIVLIILVCIYVLVQTYGALRPRLKVKYQKKKESGVFTL